MRRRRFLCRVVLSGLVMFAVPTARAAVAQDHAQHDSHGASPGPLRLEADGARNPALISDYHAYRQFIFAASLRDDSAHADRRRRQAFVSRIGLSPNDEALLSAALRNVRERIDAVATDRRALGPAAGPLMRVALKQQEEAIFAGANRRIRAFLSKDGWRRLDQFVQAEIKPRTRVYTAESR